MERFFREFKQLGNKGSNNSMSSRTTIPHDPVMRRYRRLHRRLMNFLQSVTIDHNKMLLNEYLRAENAVLREFLLRKESKIRWTAEDKTVLAQKAIKFKKWHTFFVADSKVRPRTGRTDPYFFGTDKKIEKTDEVN